jgi:hypothetical protein
VFTVASASVVVVKLKVDVGPVGGVETMSVSEAFAVSGVVNESVTTKVTG